MRPPTHRLTLDGDAQRSGLGMRQALAAPLVLILGVLAFPRWSEQSLIIHTLQARRDSPPLRCSGRRLACLRLDDADTAKAQEEHDAREREGVAASPPPPPRPHAYAHARPGEHGAAPLPYGWGWGGVCAGRWRGWDGTCG